MSGDLDGSIALKRSSNSPYRAEPSVVKLTAVAGKTRVMPGEFLKGNNDVSDAFIEYITPLVGEMPIVESF